MSIKLMDGATEFVKYLLKHNADVIRRADNRITFSVPVEDCAQPLQFKVVVEDVRWHVPDETAYRVGNLMLMVEDFTVARIANWTQLGLRQVIMYADRFREKGWIYKDENDWHLSENPEKRLEFSCSIQGIPLDKVDEM